MTDRKFEPTRRETLGMVVAAPLAATIPFRADASFSLEAAFRKALAGAGFPWPGSELSLVRFDEATSETSAVIRLTWPPGMRQRKITVSETNPDQALPALLRATLEGFPDGIKFAAAA